jgi:hypothetical protein
MRCTAFCRAGPRACTYGNRRHWAWAMRCLCARPVVGEAPFMVHLADDLIDAPVPCLKQMAACACDLRR